MVDGMSTMFNMFTSKEDPMQHSVALETQSSCVNFEPFSHSKVYLNIKSINSRITLEGNFFQVQQQFNNWFFSSRILVGRKLSPLVIKCFNFYTIMLPLQSVKKKAIVYFPKRTYRKKCIFWKWQKTFLTKLHKKLNFMHLFRSRNI